MVASLTGHAISHPLDTICVCLQAGRYSGFVDCVNSIWDEHGIGGFYQGFAATMIKVYRWFSFICKKLLQFDSVQGCTFCNLFICGIPSDKALDLTI